MHDEFNPGPENHEAAMARADLYKLANYSMKLFKMIHEGQELEGWVQAKVTKAADYIASVYHFMEYEMKASEYGNHLENAEVYSESVRRVFQQKLVEAKKMAAKVKEKAKKEELEERVVKGKGYDDPEKDSTPLKGEVPDNPWHDSRAAKFLAKQVTGSSKNRKIRGKAQHDDEDKKVSEANGDGNLANNAKPYDKVTRGDVIAGRLGKDAKGGKNKKVKETSHQASTTMKHIKDPTPGEKKAAKDIKPGVKGYRDRVDMLKSAEKDGRLKEASKSSVDKK